MLSHFCRQESGGRPDSLSQAQGEVALHHWQVLLLSHSPAGVGLGHTAVPQLGLFAVFHPWDVHIFFLTMKEQKINFLGNYPFLGMMKVKNFSTCNTLLQMHVFLCLCWSLKEKQTTVFQYFIWSLLSNTSVSQLVSSSNLFFSISLLFLPCSVHLWLGREN